MKVEKLELKHLVSYLPYGLTWFCLDQDSREFEELPTCKLYDLEKQTLEIGGMDIDLDELPYPNGLTIKPILRPLSDLRMFVSFSVLDNLIGVDVYTDKLTYIELSYLFQNHFDVFGLIDSGLAVDINTLKHEK